MCNSLIWLNYKCIVQYDFIIQTTHTAPTCLRTVALSIQMSNMKFTRKIFSDWECEKYSLNRHMNDRHRANDQCSIFGDLNHGQFSIEGEWILILDIDRHWQFYANETCTMKLQNYLN